MVKILVTLLLAYGAVADELDGFQETLTGMHEKLISNMLLPQQQSFTDLNHPPMAWLSGGRHSKAEYKLLNRGPSSLMQSSYPGEPGSHYESNSPNQDRIANDNSAPNEPEAKKYWDAHKAPLNIYPDVTSEEKTPDGASTVELTRFVTPYKFGMNNFIDVTKFAPIFSAAQHEHKIILHELGDCTQCGINWCAAGFELDEPAVEAKAFKVAERLSKWGCDALNSAPVRKPWKNSETGAMFVAEVAPILTMYSMIDTWVGPDDKKKLLYYMPNKTMAETKKVEDKCYEMKTDDGQGWVLSADLVFFHGPEGASVKPREVISLASGFFSTVGLGTISDHQAKITAVDKKVHLSKPIDLTGVTDAVVYGCKEGPGKILEHAIADYIARKSETVWLKDGNSIDQVQQDFEEFLIGGELHQIETIEEALPEYAKDLENAFVAKYDPKAVAPAKGLPVFYSNVITEDWLVDADGHKRLWNLTFPFKPVGSVSHVDGRKHKVIIEMNYSCYSHAGEGKGVKLMIPSSKNALRKIQQFVQDAMDLGKLQAAVDFGASGASETERFKLPMQDRVGQLKLPLQIPSYVESVNKDEIRSVPVAQSGHPVLQQIFEIAGAADRKEAEAGKVCVVVQRKHGQVFRKKFNLEREDGDRVLANIAVTGHGWEYTQEQCGEYCDIMYQLKFNNDQAINITQWRGDCNQNPHGANQSGTWDESRNGWCPGTVEPGAMVDITKHLTKTDEFGEYALNEQTVTLDVLVYSSETGQYEPYSNIRGWIFGDNSILKIALSLHVYPKQAYLNAMNRFARCSQADQAFHHADKVFGDETPATHKNILSVQRSFIQTGKGDSMVELHGVPKRSLALLANSAEETNEYDLSDPTAVENLEEQIKELEGMKTFGDDEEEKNRQEELVLLRKDLQAAKASAEDSQGEDENDATGDGEEDDTLQAAEAEDDLTESDKYAEANDLKGKDTGKGTGKAKGKGKFAKSKGKGKGKFKGKFKGKASPWKVGPKCWDFKGTGPWYNTKPKFLHDLIQEGMATRLPVFKKVYINKDTRYLTVPINLHKMSGMRFSQVGLHFRLTKPDDMQYDHWDRVGSIGLEFIKSSKSAHVEPKADYKPEPLDPATVEHWNGARSYTAVAGLLVALLAFFA